jgi:uncharacterized protein (TIGR04255 family)
MYPIKKLVNPPIKEAIISISFTGVEVTRLSEFCELVKNDYPKQKGMYELKAIFENEELSSEGAKLVGHQVLSNEEKQLITLRVNTFSFHRIEPYNSWEELKEESEKYFVLFNTLFPNLEITEIGTRYINALKLEMNEDEGFSKYLKLLPQLPDELPKAVDSYFLQIRIPKPEQGLSSVITQYFNQTDTPNTVEIILDIHTFKKIENNNADIWNSLELLRAFKNDIFFNSITEVTKTLYND